METFEELEKTLDKVDLYSKTTNNDFITALKLIIEEINRLKEFTGLDQHR